MLYAFTEPPPYAFAFTEAFAYANLLGCALISNSPWLRYFIATRKLAKNGDLPRRPGQFLDWAYSAGILRLSGTASQFRHQELQGYFTAARPYQPARPSRQRSRFWPKLTEIPAGLTAFVWFLNTGGLNEARPDPAVQAARHRVSRWRGGGQPPPTMPAVKAAGQATAETEDSLEARPRKQPEPADRRPVAAYLALASAAVDAAIEKADNACTAAPQAKPDHLARRPRPRDPADDTSHP